MSRCRCWIGTSRFPSLPTTRTCLLLRPCRRRHYALLFSDDSEDAELIAVENKAEYWSAAFQQTTQVNFQIVPGERLDTHCVYDTTKVCVSVSVR